MHNIVVNPRSLWILGGDAKWIFKGKKQKVVVKNRVILAPPPLDPPMRYILLHQSIKQQR